MSGNQDKTTNNKEKETPPKIIKKGTLIPPKDPINKLPPDERGDTENNEGKK